MLWLYASDRIARQQSNRYTSDHLYPQHSLYKKGIALMTYEEIKNHPEVCTLLEKGDRD